MRTGGNFWNDATIGGKDIDLGNDNIAQNFYTIFHDGSSGFIATSFNSQDFHSTIITYFERNNREGLLQAWLLAHPFEGADMVAVCVNFVFWFVEVFDTGWNFWHGGG